MASKSAELDNVEDAISELTEPFAARTAHEFVRSRIVLLINQRSTS